MDPLIALLLCSSPLAGSPTDYHDGHAMAIRHAVEIDANAQRASPYSYVVRVADTADSAFAIAPWQTFIAEAAQRFGIPQAWIRAVVQAESRGQATVEGRPIVSPAGAIGLMQVMPETYAAMRRRHGLGPDPADPRDNILAGTAYLREMLDRFGYPHLFAAYNAGPDRFEAYRRGELPLPAETQAYLAQLEADLAHTNDSSVPPAPSSPQSVAVERRHISDPRLFFPLGRRSTPLVERNPMASPAKSAGPDRPLAPARNSALFVFPESSSLPPQGDQGPP